MYRSDFRIKIEESIEALLKLGLDLFARALDQVHGDVCLVAVDQLQRSIVNLFHFALGQQPHSVDKSQICHGYHLIYAVGFGSSRSAAGLRAKGRRICTLISEWGIFGRAVYNLLGNLMTETRDTVILGSGCAGLTAAIYSARANLKPLVLEGHEPGGQLSITSLVENFPGWPEGIQGPELIDNMKKQAARFGAEFQLAHLSRVELEAHPFRLHTSAGEILTRTLIIASGASARWLGLAERAGADRAWRFKLRDLRRVLLPRQADCGGGRRRFRDGGGAVPDAVCERR